MKNPNDKYSRIPTCKDLEFPNRRLGLVVLGFGICLVVLVHIWILDFL